MPWSRKNRTVRIALPVRSKVSKTKRSAPCTSTSGSRSVDQATGGDLKLAAASLIELAAPHAGPENMQLGLTHRAFEPEQQPVVEAGWVVDAILVENKSGGQRA